MTNIFADGAHTHGHLNIDFITEKNKNIIEIHGSADCFLGFENKPKNKKQKETLNILNEKTQNHTSLQKIILEDGL